ncbi:MAG: DUF4032 domain-containing protein [Solirubrobacterales bacterium]|nr:DUF4032 domain-containing protein [Solirubrobacterales bacterium]MBV9810218.1 DUF4032 domain-containing protein [Solirubrobacterales bacterium]
MSRRALDIRLRSPSPHLLALPWQEPLGLWDPTVVPFRDVPVGPSRHLVRFVELGEGLLALKEAPEPLIRREYDVLRALESRRLPAVRVIGVVLRGAAGHGVLVTRFLDHSWQYRRLFMRLAPGEVRQRERLLAAMANLLVELHRSGIFWGDCSLANTLFVRDGQTLQAHFVDAETSEVHAALSAGQRHHDLEIMVENVAAGLIDIAQRSGHGGEDEDCIAAAESVASMYAALWSELHRDLAIATEESWRIACHLRRLQELGYAVDEIRMERDSDGEDRLRVSVAVAGRNHHAEELRALTGIAVREGQAAILLGDARAFVSRQPDQAHAFARWRREMFDPGIVSVRDIGAPHTDPVQALCDLMEVRWLLSQQAGADIGASAALAALRNRDAIPAGAAASMSVLDPPTNEMSLP